MTGVPVQLVVRYFRLGHRGQSLGGRAAGRAATGIACDAVAPGGVARTKRKEEGGKEGWMAGGQKMMEARRMRANKGGSDGGSTRQRQKNKQEMQKIGRIPNERCACTLFLVSARGLARRCISHITLGACHLAVRRSNMGWQWDEGGLRFPPGWQGVLPLSKGILRSTVLEPPCIAPLFCANLGPL